jgi:hypothetical protein
VEPLFSPARVEAAEHARREVKNRFLGSDPENLRDYGRFVEAWKAAWPDALWEALRPPHDDPSKLDTALRFLEEDPFFFRSGYTKVYVLRRLPRWPLTSDARRRIADIVLRAVDGPPRREFRWQAKAAHHADREILVPSLRATLETAEGTQCWQAFCAAHCLLGLGFPNREQRRHLEPEPQIAAMRERLRNLPQAR